MIKIVYRTKINNGFFHLKNTWNASDIKGNPKHSMMMDGLTHFLNRAIKKACGLPLTGQQILKLTEYGVRWSGIPVPNISVDTTGFLAIITIENVDF